MPPAGDDPEPNPRDEGLPRNPALWLKLAAAGDQQAWNHLVDDYSALVWSVARGFRLSRADAADVCQTTWLRLVENLDRIRYPEQLAGWLATTARRESLRLIRKSQREIPDLVTAEESASFFGAADDDGDPEAVLIYEQERHEFWRAFATLSERCQKLLRVVAVTPLESYAAVAEALGMPVGSIGPTRSRCLEHLKRALKAHSSASGARGPRSDTRRADQRSGRDLGADRGLGRR